jgi:hypothetical protein
MRIIKKEYFLAGQKHLRNHPFPLVVFLKRDDLAQSFQNKKKRQ